MYVRKKTIDCGCKVLSFCFLIHSPIMASGKPKRVHVAAFIHQNTLA